MKNLLALVPPVPVSPGVARCAWFTCSHPEYDLNPVPVRVWGPEVRNSFRAGILEPLAPGNRKAQPRLQPPDRCLKAAVIFSTSLNSRGRLVRR